jgi:hypothetical protein
MEILEMTNTALADALKKQGINRNENEFLCALSKFINNGGTTFRVRYFCDEVDRGVSGEGHPRIAKKGHADGADTRPPTSAGHETVAKGHENHASTTDRDGTARSAVPSGQIRSAVPAREPSKSDIKAMVLAKKQSAKAVLNIGWLGEDVVPGGPRYTELRIRDLLGMAKRQFTEGATHGRAAYACMLILWEIEKLGEIADQDQRWVDILPAETVRRISSLTEAEAMKPMVVGVLESFNPVLKHMIAEAGHAA